MDIGPTNGEVGVWGKPGSDAFLRLCYSAGDVSSVLAPCYRTGAIRVVGAEKKSRFLPMPCVSVMVVVLK